jgi:molybdopterin-guanine dinucleotide biosynthesis protein A
MLRLDRTSSPCFARTKQRRMTEQDRRWLSDRVAGVILAGGQNSRMGGRDKAFLRVNGETVFSRTLDLMRRCFPQVLVVSNSPDKYAGYAVDVTADELPGLGPLGGLHAALGRIDHPYAFVVACDMPFLRVEPIRFLVSLLDSQEAVVPRWGGDVEPLHAVYARALRSRIATAIAGGARAIREVLPLLRVEYVPESVMERVSGAEESFRNVNTPEEAARFAVQVGG